MKDISKKRRLGEFEKMALTNECTAFLQSKLPPKMKYPGSFIIPCNISNSYCAPDLLSNDDEDGDQAELEAKFKGFSSQPHFEYLELGSCEYKQLKASTEELPKLELNVLPSHIKYVFLEEKLINVLKKFKKVAGWTIIDIRGISSSFGIHKIILEDGAKGMIDGKKD
ncbi:Retrovirus-related Pol polyprotein from transposon 17.6 [Gossypium australe]|uniref:Retrovirus-related Pol polyprotein from transposon 17.6 n=1 Tax=Gossypium australe TaxID=47621 RepID=A0A5B6VXW0_9ROSI|nr:Retrovirus-related Pol polyprotein from transposon 17.6 [Gossypium australe]